MKIGVGICTYKRPAALAKCIAACAVFNNPTFDIHIQEDEPRIGVCGNKNRILQHFRGHDIIVILEDDAYPIHPDWLSAHIEAYEKTGIHHFCYPSNRIKGHIYKQIQNVQVCQHSSGMFGFFTKNILDKCGGFDERFKGYGWGHMEYSNRIARGGLAPKQIQGLIYERLVHVGYPMLENVEHLIGDQMIDCVTTKRERKKYSDTNLDLWEQLELKGEIFCPL